MPIYTKKGDKGKTSLGIGVKVWKDDTRVEAYGIIDELNSVLGIVSAHLSQKKKKQTLYLNKILVLIQDDLFAIGSYLSNPANSNLITHLGNRVLQFEKYIDEMTNKMPELSNFILPGGGMAGSYLQNARTISRRAERNLVTLSKTATINESVLQYINRLSDLLFTMSRFANHSEKIKETIWKRR